MIKYIYTPSHRGTQCLEAINAIEPVIKQLDDETNTNRALLDERTRSGRLEGAKSGRSDSIEQEPHENEINCIAISLSQVFSRTVC